MSSRKSKKTHSSSKNNAWRVLKDPTLHFFVVAAALLLGQRLVVGNPRTIAITPAHYADLKRRLQDQLSHPPTEAEFSEHVRLWKRDEALYREALREGIDKEDSTVRTALINKMRERALLQTRIPEPTESDLQQFLEHHRSTFEAPASYEHEYVAFPKSEPISKAKLDGYAHQLAAGATPAALGLRSVAAVVNRERIEQELGPEAAKQITRLPIGEWKNLDTPSQWLLVRMIRVEGGLPEPAVLHERLVSAWKGEKEQKALDNAMTAIANRYHFEEPSE